jgi:hypothetical protein
MTLQYKGNNGEWVFVEGKKISSKVLTITNLDELFNECGITEHHVITCALNDELGNSDSDKEIRVKVIIIDDKAVYVVDKEVYLLENGKTVQRIG